MASWKLPDNGWTSVLLNKQIEKTLKVYISFSDLESARQWIKYEIKVLDYKIEKDKSSKSFGVLETAGKWLEYLIKGYY